MRKPTTPRRQAVCRNEACGRFHETVLVAPVALLECKTCRGALFPPSSVPPKPRRSVWSLLPRRAIAWGVALAVAVVLGGAVWWALPRGADVAHSQKQMAVVDAAPGLPAEAAETTGGRVAEGRAGAAGVEKKIDGWEPAETKEATKPLAPTEARETASTGTEGAAPAAEPTESREPSDKTRESRAPSPRSSPPRKPLPKAEPAAPRRSEGERLVSEGQRLAAAGRHEAARHAFGRAVEADPASPFAWANLGAAEMVLGGRDRARTAYREALRLDPENWLAHYNLGLFWARAGDPGVALGHLEKSLRALAGAAGRKQRREVLEELRTHPDFAALRYEARFQEMLDEHG